MPSDPITITSFPPPSSSMASLQDLLAQDGFHHPKLLKPHQLPHPTLPIHPTNPPSLPSASICFDRKSLDLPGRRPTRSLQPDGSSSFASNRSNSISPGSNRIAPGAELGDRRQHCAARPNGSSHSASCSSGRIAKSIEVNTIAVDMDPWTEPATDGAAVHTVVTFLSGYVGRFLKDVEFRQKVRGKCGACLAAARSGAAHAVLANLELGMESIERLAANGSPATSADSRIRSLRNSIRLLSIVAALNSPKLRDGYTCGVPNTHLSACAQLYLAVVYKIERNDRASARHLLQVFVNAPFLARKNLVPDLWEHFFLPHLLHLKVWYNKEVELVAGWDAEEREQRIKGLNRVYNDHMDAGTAKFAMYYKDWLKTGGAAPAVPSVPLPSSCIEPWGKRSTLVSPYSINRNLYQAVFGPSLECKDADDGVSIDHSKFFEEEEKDVKEVSCRIEDYVHFLEEISFAFNKPQALQDFSSFVHFLSRQSDMGGQERPSNHEHEQLISEAVPTPRRSLSFRLFSCHSEPNKGAIRRIQSSKIESAEVAREPESNPPVIDLTRAITLISNSNNLAECETAVHVVAKAWLESHENSTVGIALSASSAIEGLLEISFTSKDERVLELAISILAELVAKNEVNRQVVLNADPQLEIFLRLLRSSLFLKAAVLLYLLKPKAKQMLSLDWIPLVLRILEHGDQLQTLFTLLCSPRLAAFYLLDQLLMGFDVDRNVENAKQMVALGGLGLLIRRLETGDACERKRCASLLATCIRADGACRDYLAANIKKASVIKLLVGNQLKSDGSALSLLTELVSLNRRTQITKFLNDLKHDGCLNTMHVLLVHLQQAPVEQRPLAAAMLLQLDLLGDPLQYSVYREEGIDAIVAALERSLHNKKVQEHCSRALLLLASRFSCEGESTAEAWLLKRAGLDDGPADLYNSMEMVAVEFARQEEEEKATELWLRKLANVLLKSGNKRFLVALSNCIADGIPCLARSCLVTVAWMSNSLSIVKNASSLQSLACSILAPRLLESLNYDRALEERVLASLSLLNYVRNSECVPKLFPFNKETIGLLQDLAHITWTAKELLFACCR